MKIGWQKVLFSSRRFSVQIPLTFSFNLFKVQMLGGGIFILSKAENLQTRTSRVRNLGVSEGKGRQVKRIQCLSHCFPQSHSLKVSCFCLALSVSVATRRIVVSLCQQCGWAPRILKNRGSAPPRDGREDSMHYLLLSPSFATADKPHSQWTTI